ncbi:ABC transporter permease [Paenibacillus sp. P46E]|uniref:ABC transporter permease n=1 Tax=Paenibacillus sp. P46E TaxID=1349436 RepID=UPI000B193DAF|nr:FtsX-like permease family protein [Paenibacillus sp. P46E]
MRIRDISRMAWDQVKRRKVVTGLCMTGISIGCAAIIVALSVGQSAQVYVTNEVNRNFKMDEITVSPGGGLPSPGGKGAGGGSGSGVNSNLDPGKLTFQKLKIIQGLNHVVAAAPFEDNGYRQMITVDNKIADVQVIATDLRMLNKFDKSFKQGGASDIPGMVVLNYGATLGLIDIETRQNIYDRMNSDPFNQEVSSQYNNLMLIPSEMYRQQVQLQAQDYSASAPNGVGPTKLSSPLQVGGILANPPGTSDDRATYEKVMYVSLETAAQLQHELSFTDANGTVPSLEEGSYNSVTVKVDSVDNIKPLEALIQKLSLSANDNLYQQEQLKEQFDTIKMAALGIGVFILVIASISIIVAMTMSTHQRRRQIGIMKVLGANMGQIRNMFITEAALLGLLGGLLGVLFSYLIVMALNKLVGTAGEGLNFFIPLTTLPIGLSFAIMTGVLSGIYPAISASRTDALTAIKRD